MTTVFTDGPALVAGCVDCLELAAEDLVQDNEHWPNCLHCQQEISAQSGVEWRRVAHRDDKMCGVHLGGCNLRQRNGRGMQGPGVYRGLLTFYCWQYCSTGLYPLGKPARSNLAPCHPS